MNNHEYQWLSTNINKYQWNRMCCWTSVILHGCGPGLVCSSYELSNGGCCLRASECAEQTACPKHLTSCSSCNTSIFRFAIWCNLQSYEAVSQAIFTRRFQFHFDSLWTLRNRVQSVPPALCQLCHRWEQHCRFQSIGIRLVGLKIRDEFESHWRLRKTTGRPHEDQNSEVSE